MSTTRTWTEADLMALPRDGFKRELVDGVIHRVVPNLVVEVLSPGDSRRQIVEKVGEYLSAGVNLIWVVDPATRMAACYRSLTDVRLVHADSMPEGVLDGEDVVPGFRCRLADVLG